jgi:RecB family exonuclease
MGNIMPTPQPKKITSWSFTRYNTYSQCPAKAKFKFIDKLKEPDSPQMQRGTDIHKLAENYVKGEIVRLPKELVLFKY